MLRRREMLGLLVDWGYRSDGIPVRLFDAWTTLPAGPATLAAKTGSRILPVAIHRLPDGTFGVSWDAPIVVASNDPAELQRATQAIADALAGRDPGRARPVVQLQADVARGRRRRSRPRAPGQGDAGRPAGSRARPRPAPRRGRPGRDRRRRDRERRAMTFRGRLMFAASWLACRLPEGRSSASPGWPATCGTGSRRAAPPRRAATSAGSCTALAASGRGSAAVRAAATDPRALERLVRSAFRHAARYYLEVARNPGVTREFVDERLAIDTPELIAEAVVPGKAVLFVGLHFGSVELAVVYLAFQVGETVTPMETVDDPGLQAYFERTRGVDGVRLVGLSEARRDADRGAPQRHPGRARRRPRPDRRWHPDPAVRGAGHPADGSGHARGRERRPGLRDDRATRRRRPFPGQAHPDRRARSTARAASESRPR